MQVRKMPTTVSKKRRGALTMIVVARCRGYRNGRIAIPPAQGDEQPTDHWSGKLNFISIGDRDD